MRKRIEMTVIFGLLVALGAVAAGLAHMHEEALNQDPTTATPPERASAVESVTPLEPPAADSTQWEEYTPSAHCGLGSGLHDIDCH